MTWRTACDFVEAPSQIMENWIWQPEILKKASGHHQTGEPISDELIQGLVDSRDFGVGAFMLSQIRFGQYDMAMHSKAHTSGELQDIWQQLDKRQVIGRDDTDFQPATIGHFVSGYDAGYYGYMWAQVFGDDMFSRFEEEGLLNETVGREWRTAIYEAGGAVDAVDMIRNFLGRDPSSDAFLCKLGIQQ